MVVLLGGPLSVNDEQDYPFLVPELAYVAARLKSERPVLGLCLGAQLIARALGSHVYPMGQREIGWSALALSDESKEHPVRHLARPGVEVMHFHGETFDLPSGARLLASTALCRHQAFSLGRHALGLQFHPEVTAEGLESWWVGRTAELAAQGLRVPALRRESQEKAPRLSEALGDFGKEWLASL